MSGKKTKFKQTEVGMIPEDWEVKNVGSLVQDCSYGVGAEAVPFNGEVKYIRITDINDDSHRFDPSPLTSPSFFEEKHFVSKNDLLIARTGASVGKTYLYDENDEKLVYAGFLIKMNICKANAKFVFYSTLTKYYQNWIAGESARTGQPGVNLQQIKSFMLALPSIEEQTAIATALSDIDHLIESLGKLIAKKKRIKQGAMQQLLTGKKRLPGFGPKASPRSARNAKCAAAKPGFKQTELGTIPMDWEVKKFGELFDMSTATISVENIDPEFYVGTENMLQNKMGVVKNAVVLACSNVREYRKNDVLVSNIRPYLKKIWLADKNGGCSTDVLVFRVKNKNFNPSFLYSVVADDRFFNIVNENAIGTKMPRGDKSVIKQIMFAVPSTIEEQTAIAQVLGDMDLEIGTLEAKLAKYRKLKTGMMQQLLTGKIRLV